MVSSSLDTILEVFRLVHGTSEIFTLREFNSMRTLVTQGLKLGPKDFFNRGLNNPVNLHYGDLIWSRMMSMVVSPKADGQRKLLVIRGGVVWLVLGGTFDRRYRHDYRG